MKRTFQSFVMGCRVNEAERAQIDRKLVEAGYIVDTHSPEVLIINTCAITAKAERELRQLISQMRRKYPEAKIVITGCSATYWYKHSSPSLTMADLVVPNAQKASILEVIESKWTVDTVKADLPQFGHVDDKFRHSNRLLVKIQDGCHRFCTYCIVPYLRESLKSVSIQDILSYIQSFSPTPSEVILSAINTESFGKDTGENLIQLISRLLKKTTVQRIGFGSIHPWSLTQDFVSYCTEELSQEKRFLPFFHVPLQSCSNTILKRMNRPYSIEDIEKRILELSIKIPNAFIATDIIVGFLGETNELFEETYKKLEKLPIHRIHVFRFSNRPHTQAFELKRTIFEVSSKEKKERAHRLIALSNKKYHSFIQMFIGKRISALSLYIDIKRGGTRILLHNQVEGYIPYKKVLPGTLLNVTIKAIDKKLVLCEMES